jgi:phosphoribosylformylglycinamidine cyclo-ligase
MPGFYADGEYDIAGFIVGAVDRARIVDGKSILPGDVLIGLLSAGLHTNGYSLARRVLFEIARWRPETFVPELQSTVADALLAPHRSYLTVLKPILAKSLVKGLAHITGGGITDNLPRILPDGTAAEISRASWKVPPIFQVLQHHGQVQLDEMFRAFNMGIGLILVCASSAADATMAALAASGEQGYRIGRIVSGQNAGRQGGLPYAGRGRDALRCRKQRLIRLTGY